MKILTVIGARPQFVKAATVSRQIANYENVREVIVHTGQHYDANMSDVFFEQMKIPLPDHSLNVSGLPHGAMTGRMIEGIESILQTEKADYLLVYGDTNSTLAGALAASKMHIPIAHVEAGLRSFNMRMPEEQNRIITDRLSSLLFCPTTVAVDNLEKEGFRNFGCKIANVGDVMQDAAIFYEDMGQKPCNVDEAILNREFALATIHRAENTDDIKRLRSILGALNEIHQDCPIILPIHPRTQAIIRQNNIATNMIMIDPVGYLEMIYLLKRCKIVLTDSGGLQKEAFFFASPCVTIRDETEWTELVTGGYNMLAGSDKNDIIRCYEEMKGRDIVDLNGLYGGGQAAEKIVIQLTRQ